MRWMAVVPVKKNGIVSVLSRFRKLPIDAPFSHMLPASAKGLAARYLRG